MNCTYQSACEADHSDGVVSRLRGVQEIVEQGLVLVVGKQVKLVQHKYDALVGMGACEWRNGEGGRERGEGGWEGGREEGGREEGGRRRMHGRLPAVEG